MILLYTYDYDEYIKKREIYYNHLDEIAPGPILNNMAELITALQNISEIEKKDKSKSIKLRNYFNKFNDGKSSERLLKILKLI